MCKTEQVKKFTLKIGEHEYKVTITCNEPGKEALESFVKDILKIYLDKLRDN